ncbi:MAG: GNAT family N-acetyltransferase [Treponema sp.]|nr:GNAT family N-acetyltransferase [Treponema sp.]
MTLKEKLTIIDEWLIFRRRLIADTKLMNLVDNGIYEYMFPVEGSNGPSEIFNIRLENLDDVELYKTIKTIKDLDIHTEWPMACSERVSMAIYGEILFYPLKEFALGIMMAKDMLCYSNTTQDLIIRQVTTKKDFTLWCDINRFDYGSFNADSHYHIVEESKFNCFLGLVSDKHVAISAVVNDNGAAALDFVHVLPEYRERGYATALSQYSIKWAFENKAKFLVGWGHPTFSPGSSRLFKKLKFPIISSE